MSSSSPTYGTTTSSSISTVSCNSGQYLVAISGQYGEEVTNMTGYCSDNNTVSSTTGSSLTGGCGGGGDTDSCKDTPYFFFSNNGAGFDGVQVSSGNSIDSLHFRHKDGQNMTEQVGGTGGNANSFFACPNGQVITGWTGRQGEWIHEISFNCGTPTSPPQCEYNPQLEDTVTTGQGVACDEGLNAYIKDLNKNLQIDAENVFNNCLYNQQTDAWNSRLAFFENNGAVTSWNAYAPQKPSLIPPTTSANPTITCCNQSVNLTGAAAKDAVGQVIQTCSQTTNGASSSPPSSVSTQNGASSAPLSTSTQNGAASSAPSPVSIQISSQKNLAISDQSAATKTSGSSSVITSQDWIYIAVAVAFCLILMGSSFFAIYSFN
ncbi:hypothetical protein BDK51DRAFT_49116 [Blyttiomyces helicus]|uniref:Uncharacterized protein n=1 Tax=Blyttiomyces helicus TaxID=388810 RepID=A0A4V1IR24_9FUNG|nr:hypothetical protein BDK51DRAFT_49116 [Blyttiomyces helicus]|eukprot:RKO88567.1 hypothetical protein BDK51DRAFT_49116 [Blyttiomyces helicus]